MEEDDNQRRIRYLTLCTMAYQYMMTATVAVAVALEDSPPPRKKRRVWVWPYLQRKAQYGHYDTLMDELYDDNPELYRNYIRMDRQQFMDIVELISPIIERKNTRWRPAIDPRARLAITLRFLATGDSYKSLQYAFRVAHNTISGIVPDTCNAIITAMAPEHLQLPTTEDQWIKIAKGFNDKWNLPHCIGAVDGKHIRIQNPHLAGSHFFNYKKFYSMVLMAVVDADYKFIYIDVGAVVAESDGGVWARTGRSHMLHSGEAHLPQPKCLPNTPHTSSPSHYYLVADDAFPLRPYLMKPFPCRGLTKEERIYNYRLSRARRTVENAFGILASRFRVLHTSMCLRADRVEAVVMAACVLHNLLRNLSLEGDTINPQADDTTDGTWRNDPQLGQPLQRTSGNTSNNEGKAQRNLLKDYVNSPQGSVPWQDGKI